MSEAPVQVIVAAFSDQTSARQMMDDLKQGRKEGLIGIIDAAVVVKDENGKLKVIDSKRRSRRTTGLITGGVVGGLVGLLAGPVGWAALGGGAVGMLAGRLAGLPTRRAMEAIGEALTPGSSAIVAVIEHKWIPQIEEALIEAGASVLRSAIAADIRAQLEAGGNVLYTAAAGEPGEGVARVAEGPEGVRVTGVIAFEEGIFISDAQFTDEEPEAEGGEKAGEKQ